MMHGHARPQLSVDLPGLTRSSTPEQLCPDPPPATTDPTPRELLQLAAGGALKRQFFLSRGEGWSWRRLAPQVKALLASCEEQASNGRSWHATAAASAEAGGRLLVLLTITLAHLSTTLACSGAARALVAVCTAALALCAVAAHAWPGRAARHRAAELGYTLLWRQMQQARSYTAPSFPAPMLRVAPPRPPLALARWPRRPPPSASTPPSSSGARSRGSPPSPHCTRPPTPPSPSPSPVTTARPPPPRASPAPPPPLPPLPPPPRSRA